MLLEITPEITTGINAVYAAFLTLIAFMLNNFVTWWRNRKPKAQMKLTLEQLDTKITAVGLDVTVCKDDIKDCKLSIQSVRVQQRARLEFQLNASQEMYLLFNEDGECTFANDALTQLVERPKEQLMYQGWIDIIHPQAEKERVLDHFDRAFNRQIAVDVDTTLYTYTTRKAIPVCIQSKPIWDDEGNPLWFSAKIVRIDARQ